MINQTLPKISVIVRTIGHVQLPRAVESVRRQTWPNIELILVVANPDFDMQPWANDPQVVLVAPGKSLDRPNAANVGLGEATGAWVQFLDEDDWIDPEHVETLWRAVEKVPDLLLAYSDTRVHKQGADFVRGRGYWKQIHPDQPTFSVQAALFSCKLRDLGCSFDEQFVLLEDWDFFLQCAEHTDFLHVPVATAHYDPHSGTSGGGIGSNRNEELLRPYLDKLTAKWGPRYGDIVAQANEALGQADAAIGQKNYIVAEQAALKGLSADPGNPLLLNRLAVCCREAGNWAGVIKALRRACDSDPTAFRIHSELALLEHKFGFPEKAAALAVRLETMAGTDEEKASAAALKATIAA